MTKQDLVAFRNALLAAQSATTDAIGYAELALRKAKDAEARVKAALAKLDEQQFTDLYNSLPE